MDEKKLTDEEILKTLEEMASECPANFSGSVLDLINRLQAEKEELKNEYVKLDLECQKLQTENAELKSPKFANWKVKFFKAQAEIERLKIDIKNEKNWGKIQTKQAGQSTAKEIFTDLLKEFSIRKSCGNADVVVREMASRKGVEVE